MRLVFGLSGLVAVAACGGGEPPPSIQQAEPTTQPTPPAEDSPAVTPEEPSAGAAGAVPADDAVRAAAARLVELGNRSAEAGYNPESDLSFADPDQPCPFESAFADVLPAAPATRIAVLAEGGTPG